MRAHLAAFPLAGFVPGIDTISRCILADNQQLLRTRRDELFGFAQHGIDPAAGQFAAERGDDAKGAAMVAAL